jgi:hypothetical protein
VTHLPETSTEVRSLGEGAAQAAPTAPHATPRDPDLPASGPERFWQRRSIRLGFVAALALAAIAHEPLVQLRLPHRLKTRDVAGVAAVPTELLEGKELEIRIERAEDSEPVVAKDVHGNAAIPVNLFVQSEAKPPSPSESPKPKDDSETADPALRAQRRDGGVRDASGDSASDSAVATNDAAAEAAASDADVALGTDIKRTASEISIEAMLAPTDGSRTNEPVKVVLILNGDVIRAHPLAARLGALLRRLPGWDEVLRGTELDPLRDTDWVMLSGPSLVNSARDVLLLHYSALDSVVDRAVAAVSRRYERGGPVDAGVPGVKASLVRPDRSERMLLRPQNRLLAVVPPTVSRTIARQLVGARFAGQPRPGDAVYLRLVDPHEALPEVPAAITELLLRVVPRPDQGADVFLTARTASREAASTAARELEAALVHHNDPFTAVLTQGLLGRTELSTEGRIVRARVAVERAQIERVLSVLDRIPRLRVAAPNRPPPSTPGGSESSTTSDGR